MFDTVALNIMNFLKKKHSIHTLVSYMKLYILLKHIKGTLGITTLFIVCV